MSSQAPPPDQNRAGLAPRALAADYDGTLAEAGRVAAATLQALRRLKSRGWLLLLVTGRQLDDLQAAFPEHSLCDAVVAENGAVLFRPPRGPTTLLASPPSPLLLGELERREVEFSIGRVVVATTSHQAAAAREAISASSSAYQLVFNREALMLLPAGVDKRTGLLAALEQLGLAAAQVVAVGDAENDLPFLRASGRGVAVANAVAELREAAQLVTAGKSGEGVRELVERLLTEECLPDELSKP